MQTNFHILQGGWIGGEFSQSQKKENKDVEPLIPNTDDRTVIPDTADEKLKLRKMFDENGILLPPGVCFDCD